MRIPWRRLSEPESILLALALVNWIYIRYLITSIPGTRCCFGCPWYLSWGAHEPLRLLLAAAALRLGKKWAQALAALLSAQVFVLGIYFGLSVGEWRAARAGLDDWPFALQGLLGGLLLGLAWSRLKRGTRHRRAARWLTRLALAALALVAAGVVSSFVSARTCEDRVAAWVARDLLEGQPFVAWGGIRGWADSADIFRRVGARVRERHGDVEAGELEATVGAWQTAPFIVRVRYVAQPSGESGVRVFLCFFGSIRPKEGVERWLWLIDRAVLATTTAPWYRLRD